MMYRPESRAVRLRQFAGSVLALALVVAAPCAFAQGTDARTALIERARAMDARNRADLGAQGWAQVLLSDPNNVEALAGAARDYKLTGNAAQSDMYLNRLKRVSPNDANIARIGSMSSAKPKDDRLKQAAALAAQGKPDDAVKLYRQVYGGTPPDGDAALGFYQTLYATASGKAEAISGMRGLVSRYPGNATYAVALGRTLTYNPDTRNEGMQILRRYPKDREASAALRQALVWGNSESGMRAYMAEHPEDTDMAAKLKQDEGQHRAAPANGLVRTPAEQAAYGALNAKRLEDAEERFKAILDKEPTNGRAAAGLGFVYMQRQNFASAVTYLEQARQNGVKEQSVASALDTAKFWNVMAEATDAAGKSQNEQALAGYRKALAMRPGSRDALNGLAGLYVRDAQYGQAADIYAQLVKADAKDAAAWRGLFLAEARDSQAARALDTAAKFPPAVKASLSRDPEFLQVLSQAYTAVGDDAAAERTLSAAMALPLPTGAKNDTKLQYAAMMGQSGKWSQAATLYSQVLVDDPGSLPAWEGLVSALHGTGHDDEAVATVEKMPPAVYEGALANAGFLSLLGGIYQSAGQYDIAQSFLERAAVAVGGHPTVAMQLQLAGIYSASGSSAKAYDVYRQILTANPENLEAWKGLLSVLQSSNRSTQALQQMQQIPTGVRQRLVADVEYQRTLASLYAATGDYQQALQWNARVQAHYRGAKVIPAAVEIQNAWLMFNIQDDRALYPALMRLGGRQDLTIDQRKTVETIWANWSVRRSGEAMAAGNRQRALMILSTALSAFPDSLEVRVSIAGGFLKAQEPKMAMAIFKDIDLTHSTSAEYVSAIGAALGAGERDQAEQWLRQALAHYSKDPSILAMAARYEQARGDDKRAEAYWKASLEAMPPVSPTDRLAHMMSRPEGSFGYGATAKIRPSTPADLARILNPDDEPFQRTVTMAPLPSYGSDPYDRMAPVGVPIAAPPAQPQSYAVPAGIFPSDSEAAAPATEVASNNSDVDVAAIAAAVASVTVPAEPAAAGVESQLAGDSAPSAPMPTMEESRAAEISGLVADVAAAGAEQPVPQSPDAPETSTEIASVPVMRDGGVYHAAQYTPSATELVPQAKPEREPKHLKTKAHRITATPQSAPSSDDVFAAPAIGQVATAPSRLPSQEDVAPQRRYQPSPTEVASLGREYAGDVETQQTGLSDQQLEQQSLPPLRGPWQAIRRAPIEVSPRDEAEEQLMRIEGSYSPWIAGQGFANHRSGNPGYDALTTLTTDLEASIPVFGVGRLTFIARPVFLDSGAADGTAIIKSSAGNIPEPFGTVMATDTNIPQQQNEAGMGGEIQLALPNISGAIGYSASGFLVSTITGRLNWKPGNGPFTINLVRDVVKDTQLSYAGLRDPGSQTLVYPGNIWGGVVSNGGTIQYTHGDANSGFYLSGGGERLYGIHVRDNTRIEGGGGAYWRLFDSVDYGNLTVGANFFGMHYTNNDRGFTYGLGGYFSPQAYVLANVPLTWAGHSGTRLKYNVLGSFGVQGFQEDKTAMFPLDPSTELANKYPYLPAQTVVGANYDLHGQVSYLLHNHWYLGGFFSVNNARDYVSGSVGFSVHYEFRQQPELVPGPPTGLYPFDGLRPLTVP